MSDYLHGQWVWVVIGGERVPGRLAIRHLWGWSVKDLGFVAYHYIGEALTPEELASGQLASGVGAGL